MNCSKDKVVEGSDDLQREPDTQREPDKIDGGCGDCQEQPDTQGKPDKIDDGCDDLHEEQPDTEEKPDTDDRPEESAVTQPATPTDDQPSPGCQKASSNNHEDCSNSENHDGVERLAQDNNSEDDEESCDCADNHSTTNVSNDDNSNKENEMNDDASCQSNNSAMLQDTAEHADHDMETRPETSSPQVDSDAATTKYQEDPVEVDEQKPSTEPEVQSERAVTVRQYRRRSTRSVSTERSMESKPGKDEPVTAKISSKLDLAVQSVKKVSTSKLDTAAVQTINASGPKEGNSVTARVTTAKKPRRRAKMSASPGNTILSASSSASRPSLISRPLSARKTLSGLFDQFFVHKKSKNDHLLVGPDHNRNVTSGAGNDIRNYIAGSSGRAKSNEENVDTMKATPPGGAQYRRPKAKKSFPARVSEEITPPNTQPTSISFSNLTMKVTEIENALGIKNKSLDKLDAKALDRILLERAQKAKVKSLAREKDQVEKNRALLEIDEINEDVLPPAIKPVPTNVSTIIVGQSILQKRKKKKMKLGTYRLPGQRVSRKKRAEMERRKDGSVEKTAKDELASVDTNSAASSKTNITGDFNAVTESDNPTKVTDGTEQVDDNTVPKVSRKNKKKPRYSRQKSKFYIRKRHRQQGKVKKETMLKKPKLEPETVGNKTTESRGVKRRRSDSSPHPVTSPDARTKHFKQVTISEMFRMKNDRIKIEPAEVDDGMFDAEDGPPLLNREDGSVQPSRLSAGTDRNTPERSTSSTPPPQLTPADKGPLVQGAVIKSGQDEYQVQTLEEVKASLDAEAAGSGQRKSRRKRKLADVDGTSASSTPRMTTDSDISSVSNKGKKRRRLNEDDTAGLSGAETADVDSPLESILPLAPHGSHVMPGDDEILCHRGLVPGQSKPPLGMPHPKVGSTVPETSTTTKQFVNTPNGMTYPYPVTPPKTPEVPSGSIRDNEKLIKKSSSNRDLILLCTCRVGGATFTNVKPTMYCQALDSIGGKVFGCYNKVTSRELVRPAVKVPFMTLCELHRQRLYNHQCCAGCGHFCTEGKFIQCKKDGERTSAIHHFHPQCQIFRDNKYYCPHCGSECLQLEVTLTLNQPRSAAFSSNTGKEAQRPARFRARMGGARVRSDHETNQLDLSSEVKGVKIAGGEREISAAGLATCPSRQELQHAIELLGSEKPKKLRADPKSLFAASRMGDVKKVLYMLVEGCDPNYCDESSSETSLHVAAEAGYLLIVHMLLQAGAFAHVQDSNLRTPLMNAASAGHLDIVRLLVKVGTIVDCRSDDGMTPLHLAAQSGHVDIVRFLLETGKVDINVKDDGGWTPIIWASEHSHLNIVRYLLSVGGDPNVRDNEENTGLHWAAYSGSEKIAEMFLNAGCDLEASNEHGDRPLHVAARQDHYETIVLFLARGADSEVRNNENQTPISCCMEESSPVKMSLRVNRELRTFAAKKLSRPQKLLHRDISLGRESNPVPVVNCADDENYPEDFQYVAKCVETAPMNVNYMISSLQACSCKDNCASFFCSCTRSSIRCWYDKEGRLIKEFNYADPPLVFECNKACRCWSNCQNRVVQLGITCRLQVFRTVGRGWGCRTLLDIPQGTFVCEYVGELLSDAEADSREDDSYLFDLDNRDIDTNCIDARRFGNVSRFINHLCEPNLIPVKVFIDHQDLRFPRICFFAPRDIKAGDELGFDYGEKFWIIKYKQFTCTCGSEKCRFSAERIQQTIEEYNRGQVEEPDPN